MPWQKKYSFWLAIFSKRLPLAIIIVLMQFAFEEKSQFLPICMPQPTLNGSSFWWCFHHLVVSISWETSWQFLFFEPGDKIIFNERKRFQGVASYRFLVVCWPLSTVWGVNFMALNVHGSPSIQFVVAADWSHSRATYLWVKFCGFDFKPRN